MLFTRKQCSCGMTQRVKVEVDELDVNLSFEPKCTSCGVEFVQVSRIVSFDEAGDFDGNFDLESAKELIDELPFIGTTPLEVHIRMIV